MSSKVSDHAAPADAPSSSGLHFVCKCCGQPLTEPGAIELSGKFILSPPDENGDVTISGTLRKDHIRRECV